MDAAEPSFGSPVDPIEILRFTTSHLSPAERYADWLARSWPRVDAIYRTEPNEPFDTLFESANLGEIMLVRTEITAMRWERRIQDIRSSDFDPIIVNMMVEGEAQGDFDGRTFREGPGQFHFHDLSRPSLHVSTASLTYSVVMARPVASRVFGTLNDLHGRVVGDPFASLLIGHAARIWSALPGLDRSAAAPLGRSFIDLLDAATTQTRASAPRMDDNGLQLRRRAEAAIESMLSRSITIALLCEKLNVPRATLFAAFQGEGGIQAYIRAQRLEKARTALIDFERNEPIGTIALRLGFYDASHLTRLFRERYGMAPRDYRRLVRNEN